MWHRKADEDLNSLRDDADPGAADPPRKAWGTALDWFWGILLAFDILFLVIFVILSVAFFAIALTL